MRVREVETPVPLSNAARQRKYRADSREKYYATRTRYRHDNSKWETDALYLSRPFVAWDGEGITDALGRHRYVMLAVSDGDGKSYYLGEPKGLSTHELLSFVVDKAQQYPKAIHVIYGGSYDFNCWLRDFSYAQLKAVYSDKFMEWNGFRIGWRQGKSFYVCRVNDKGEKIGNGVTIYDVVSFFQTSFIKACDAYLGDRFAHRELIMENKALRSSFTTADIPVVKRYNEAELENLVNLMVELRDRLNKVGLRPRRWDGPGAIAAALLMREGVKKAKAECPEPVAEAARYAYAGGRFEVIKYGHSDAPAYEYDINSAYPAALRNVPNLADGEWEYSDKDIGNHPFALYHVRSHAKRMDVPGPLPRRDGNGTICYPRFLTGWYWSPEIEVLREYCAAGWGDFQVLEVWYFNESSSDNRPFDFIEGLFNKRRALKKAGDGAHVGIKLGLNSLYGKLAQQVGWEQKPDGELRIPPFHQLEWAGYTTSYARAMVLRAALTNLESIIAFETDAVFSTAPLDVPLGSALGEFEELQFKNLTYLQSGLYFGEDIEGNEINKTRGVDRGSLTRAQCLEQFAASKADERCVNAQLTRFVTAGIALSQSFARWRRWEVMDKRITLAPTGKREHGECDACTPFTAGQSPITVGVWHHTYCPMMNASHSCQFPVEWINPDPNMSELEEMRRWPNEWE